MISWLRDSLLHQACFSFPLSCGQLLAYISLSSSSSHEGKPERWSRGGRWAEGETRRKPVCLEQHTKISLWWCFSSLFPLQSSPPPHQPAKSLWVRDDLVVMFSLFFPWSLFTPWVCCTFSSVVLYEHDSDDVHLLLRVTLLFFGPFWQPQPSSNLWLLWNFGVYLECSFSCKKSSFLSTPCTWYTLT